VYTRVSSQGIRDLLAQLKRSNDFDGARLRVLADGSRARSQIGDNQHTDIFLVQAGNNHILQRNGSTFG
jgi:hypothetical protein